MLLDQIDSFLNKFFESISETGIDIQNLYLDHIAYQASSSEDYNNQSQYFMKFSKLISEKIVDGRRVGIFKLHEEITYIDRLIPIIELIEPKPDQNLESGWQHAEFVLNCTYEDFIKNYPNIEWDLSSIDREEFSHLKLHFENGLTVKFHLETILEAVGFE